jgi:hypothetical protein
MFTVRSRGQADTPTRHFSPPWTIDDNGACFIIRDHNGQAAAKSNACTIRCASLGDRRHAAHAEAL